MLVSFEIGRNDCSCSVVVPRHNSQLNLSPPFDLSPLPHPLHSNPPPPSSFHFSAWGESMRNWSSTEWKKKSNNDQFVIRSVLMSSSIKLDALQCDIGAITSQNMCGVIRKRQLLAPDLCLAAWWLMTSLGRAGWVGGGDDCVTTAQMSSHSTSVIRFETRLWFNFPSPPPHHWSFCLQRNSRSTRLPPSTSTTTHVTSLITANIILLLTRSLLTNFRLTTFYFFLWRSTDFYCEIVIRIYSLINHFWVNTTTSSLWGLAWQSVSGSTCSRTAMWHLLIHVTFYVIDSNPYCNQLSDVHCSQINVHLLLTRNSFIQLQCCDAQVHK